MTNPSTGFTKTVKVNTGGSYASPLLQSGNYQITGEAQDFEKQDVKSLLLWR